MSHTVIKTEDFTPFHINATPEDLKGNNGINRYIFLCGSDERAKRISMRFNKRIVKEHPRQHNLYLGSLQHNGLEIDVAAIATGIGCPSADIILNELYLLGGKRFLRVGTAGSLQPNQIKVGDVVIATAAVRDEDTSTCYISPEYPAVASFDMVNAAYSASEILQLKKYVYPGIVHTKSSFYAREMGQSHLKHNFQYMESLQRAGVIASEMECSHLFVLSSVLNHRDLQTHGMLSHGVLAGGILAIIGDNSPISSDNAVEIAIERAIEIGFETIKQLASKELQHDSHAN